MTQDRAVSRTWAEASQIMAHHADVWEADGKDPCRVRISREFARVFDSYALGIGTPSIQTLRIRRDQARSERDEALARINQIRDLILNTPDDEDVTSRVMAIVDPQASSE